MEPFSSIEEKLQRMIPPALSEDGQIRLEETIDQLAGVGSDAEIESDSAARGSFSLWKVAAAVVALAVAVIMIHFKGVDAVDHSLAQIDAPTSPDMTSLQEMILLKSTRLIDGQVDDGLIVPSNGVAPHYRYRYRVVDEDQVRDIETGTVVILRQPRQEVVTIPVTQF